MNHAVNPILAPQILLNVNTLLKRVQPEHTQIGHRRHVCPAHQERGPVVLDQHLYSFAKRVIKENFQPLQGVPPPVTA